MMRRVKHGVKSILVPSLFGLGVYDRSIRRHHRRKVVIFSGHRVSSQGQQRRAGALALETGITAERFEELLRFLKAEMNPVSVDDVANFVAGKGDIPDRAVAITLDDGYRDNYTNAYPLLKEYGIPATIFLATGFIGNTHMFWWDRIGESLKRTRVDRVEKSWINGLLNGERAALPDTLDLSTHAGRNQAWDSLTTALRRCERDRRDGILAVLEERLAVEPAESDSTMLTWEQVVEMSGNGVDFGAHTVTHPSFASTTTDECEREAVESKRAIEARTGKPVISFAYPFGDFNRDQMAIMKDRLRTAGFRCAFVVESGCVRADSDPYELKRVHVGNTPLAATVRATAMVVERDR
jgi:peptidoglycan/xylan/chitin deacetylase (PgdA/CDA1 family)